MPLPFSDPSFFSNMGESRLMTEDYKHSYTGTKEEQKVYAKAIRCVLDAPATELLARRDTAQRCVTAAREDLTAGRCEAALDAYAADGLTPDVSPAVHRGIDFLPFDPTAALLHSLKARMFLSDAKAVSTLLSRCTSALSTAHRRPVFPPGTDRNTLFQATIQESAIASIGTCKGLRHIIFEVMACTLTLRGASHDLMVAFGVAGFGLLLRQLQFLLPQVAIFSEENYRWLINTSEHHIFRSCRITFGLLSRSPQLWTAIKEKIDVPSDQIKAIFKGFFDVGKRRLGWANVNGWLEAFAIILGYGDILEEGLAKMIENTTVEQRATIVLDAQSTSENRYTRQIGNDVHVCINCGKAALDEEGERLVSYCSGCRLSTYCSRECQAAHWKSQHKNECSKAAKKSKKAK